jgi:hypothetical protein
MQEKEMPIEEESEVNPYNEDFDIWANPAPFITEMEDKAKEIEQQ